MFSRKRYSSPDPMYDISQSMAPLADHHEAALLDFLGPSLPQIIPHRPSEKHGSKRRKANVKYSKSENYIKIILSLPFLQLAKEAKQCQNQIKK